MMAEVGSLVRSLVDRVVAEDAHCKSKESADEAINEPPIKRPSQSLSPFRSLMPFLEPVEQFNKSKIPSENEPTAAAQTLVSLMKSMDEDKDEVVESLVVSEEVLSVFPGRACLDGHSSSQRVEEVRTVQDSEEASSSAPRPHFTQVVSNYVPVKICTFDDLQSPGKLLDGTENVASQLVSSLESTQVPFENLVNFSGISNLDEPMEQNNSDEEAAFPTGTLTPSLSEVGVAIGESPLNQTSTGLLAGDGFDLAANEQFVQFLNEVALGSFSVGEDGTQNVIEHAVEHVEQSNEVEQSDDGQIFASNLVELCDMYPGPLTIDVLNAHINHFSQVENGYYIVNYNDNEGRTFLHCLAAKFESNSYDEDTYELSTAAMAILDLTKFDLDGDNVLHLAIKFDCVPMVRAILDNPNWNANEQLFNARNAHGDTPLHLAMTSAAFCTREYVNIFLKRSRIKNVKNNDGNTALHLLFSPGHRQVKVVLYPSRPFQVKVRKAISCEEEDAIVRSLLSEGADHLAMNKLMNIPFDLAIRKNSSQETLLKLCPSIVGEDKAKAIVERLLRLDPMPFKLLRVMASKVAEYGLDCNAFSENTSRFLRAGQVFTGNSKFADLKKLLYTRKYRMLLNKLVSCDETVARRVGEVLPYMLTKLSSHAGNKFIFPLTKALVEECGLNINRVDDISRNLLFNLIKNVSTESEKTFDYVLSRPCLDLQLKVTTTFGHVSALHYALLKGQWTMATKLALRGAPLEELQLNQILNQGFLECFQVLHVLGHTVDLEGVNKFDHKKHEHQLNMFKDFVDAKRLEGQMPRLSTFCLQATTGSQWTPPLPIRIEELDVESFYDSDSEQLPANEQANCTFTHDVITID